MRPRDVLRSALTALLARKTRTLLSVAGVAVGSYALLAGLSIGLGVQRLIEAQMEKQDQLRRVTVWPGGGKRRTEPPAEDLVVEGEMSDARRERLREAIRRRWEAPVKPGPARGLTKENLADLEKLPHVVSLRPGVIFQGQAALDGKSVRCRIFSAHAGDPFYARRLVAGALPEGDGVLVSEYAAYRWGVRDESDVAALVGKRLRLEVRQEQANVGSLLFVLGLGGAELGDDEKKALAAALPRLPQALAMIDLPEKERKALTRLLAGSGKGGDFTLIEGPRVAGIVRDVAKTEIGPFDAGPGLPADVVLPADSAERIFRTLPGMAQQGLPVVQLRVSNERHLREVEAEVKALGLEAFSFAEIIEQVRLTILLITAACALIAAVALGVSALGIANTMFMSVMERTHEIGVMKSVGARDAQVAILFVAEGAMVGAVGALLGLLAARVSAWPGDEVARRIVAKQSAFQMEGSVFAFPAWLVLGGPALVVLLTTLAGLYPALRAARIDPVQALRQR